ncbi:MAG: hypothetical protein H6737_30880 [Alphaproteobacteria bacterium]|nr:hypothetical protein [Alphaproteobacteria bacterium]
MLVLLVAACSSEAPAPPPAAPEPAEAANPWAADMLALRRAMSRAATDEAAACDALDRALALAPKVDAAVVNGELDWAAVEHDAPGLVLTSTGIRADYRELAIALGESPAAPGVITVGGTFPTGCVDPVRVDRWLIRLPTLSKAPMCMKATLEAELDRALTEAFAGCLCEVPATPPDLAGRLRAAGLDATAAKAEAWPATWKACAPSGD